MRVLIVEDDRELAESLVSVLEESGMVAEIAGNGREADFLGYTENYDAAVLDLGLPELDGISVLQHWREQGRTFPVLILTGRGRWSDKLAGFGAGADDYLTKPQAVPPSRIRCSRHCVMASTRVPSAGASMSG